MTDKGRILRSIKVNNETGCWEWMACKGRHGYGHLRYKGPVVLAHRLSYTMWRGPIPKGKCVLHHCDNRGCVNPQHLFVGTREDNMRDAMAKGRIARGELHVHSVLNEDDVRDIRRRLANAETQVSIARDYGVCGNAIWSIARGRTWKHVPLRTIRGARP